jgi:hypothetical protein
VTRKQSGTEVKKSESRTVGQTEKRQFHSDIFGSSAKAPDRLRSPFCARIEAMRSQIYPEKMDVWFCAWG